MIRQEGDRMIEIYICHQYGEPSHVEALYKCQDMYKYKIGKYIILDLKAIFLETLRMIIMEKRIIKAFRWLGIHLIDRFELRFVRDKVLVVGLAPYDNLMLKFSKVFKQNYSIYHTSYPIWDGSRFHRGRIKNKSKFETCLKECFNAVACVNNESYKQIATWFPKAQIVNHAIDVDNYKTRAVYEKTKRVNYVFIGRLVSEKNIEIILEYWKKHQNSNISISFIGEGYLQKEIESVAKMDSRVRYLGKWTKEKIKNHLCNFHFLILPSKRELFGVVLLEALAAGIPSIVSNTSGPLEIIRNGENGLIFELEDSVSFDRIMKRSYDMDENEYMSMCLQARADSKKYSYEVIAKKWMELL